MSHQDAIRIVSQKLKGISVAMLTTLDSDGTLRTRPMMAHDMDFNGTLWFFTHADTPKVENVQRERKVNIAYCKPDEHLYVTVTGTAELVRDAAKLRELWRPFLRVWFPRQLEEPDLALLKVTVSDAEYWDGSVGTLVRLAKTSDPNQLTEGGENAKLNIQ